MLYRTMAVLLSGAIGLLVTGCASSTPTMRAQSPADGYGSWADGPAAPHDCPMCQSTQGHSHGQACPPNRRGRLTQKCSPGCMGAGCNLPCHPVHRNFHTYHAPQNLMYPPENSQPAQVQFPYYTLRGPTDFFMK
jgi:hypothetical protein